MKYAINATMIYDTYEKAQAMFDFFQQWETAEGHPELGDGVYIYQYDLEGNYASQGDIRVDQLSDRNSIQAYLTQEKPNTVGGGIITHDCYNDEHLPCINGASETWGVWLDY